MWSCLELLGVAFFFFFHLFSLYKWYFISQSSIKLSNFPYKLLRLWEMIKTAQNNWWQVVGISKTKCINGRVALATLEESSPSQHSLPFSSMKKLCTKNINLITRFRFWIKQFMIQEMALFEMYFGRNAWNNILFFAFTGLSFLQEIWLDYPKFRTSQRPIRLKDGVKM